MSLSLTLLPLRRRQELVTSHLYTYTRLSFIDSYAIFGQIVDLSCYRSQERQDIPENPKIRTYPLPPKALVSVYGDDGLKYTRRDARGEMTYTYARDLKALAIAPDAAPINKAIKSLFNISTFLYTVRMTTTKRYPSDITREQFELIKPLLESARKRTHPRTYDLYDVWNALNYVLKTGCQWRALPHEYPKWRTVHEYFTIWKTKDEKEKQSILDKALKKNGRMGTYKKWQKMYDQFHYYRCPERQKH